MKNALRYITIAFCLSAFAYGDAVSDTLGFEDMTYWYSAFERTNFAMHGTYACVWSNHTGVNRGSVYTKQIPNGGDLRFADRVTFWYYTAETNNDTVALYLYSTNATQTGERYFRTFISLSVEGAWTKVEIPFSLFEQSTLAPVGYHTITKVVFNADGPTFDPASNAVWFFDDFSFTNIAQSVTNAMGTFVGTVSDTRPRVVLSEADFTRLATQKGSDANLAIWYTNAKRYLDEEVLGSAHVSYDGGTTSSAREILNRMYYLAFFFRMEGDAAYRTMATNEAVYYATTLSSWMDSVSSSQLASAEMTHALALCYDWLYDELTSSDRDAVRDAILSVGLTEASNAYIRNEFWTRDDGNWAVVCPAGYSIGAIAIATNTLTAAQSNLCEYVLSNSFTTLQHALTNFAPDGGWPEGTMYAGYVLRYLAPYYETITRAYGTNFGLGALEGVSNAGYFHIYMKGNSSFMFNISDAVTKAQFHEHTMFWLAKTFSNSDFAWSEFNGAKHFRDYTRINENDRDVRDIIYYDSDVCATTFTNIALDRAFDGVGVASMRNNWDFTNDEGIYVAVHAGNNHASHGHLDAGTFVIDALGYRFIDDLGNDDYDGAGYWTKGVGAARWDYYYARAEAHNVPILASSVGDDQYALGETRITHFEGNDTLAYVIMNLSSAYIPLGAISVRRGVSLFQGRSNVLVQDEIRLTSSDTIYWQVHTARDASLVADAKGVSNVCVLSNEDTRLYMKLIHPTNTPFIITNEAPLPGRADPPADGYSVPVAGRRKIVVACEDVMEETIAVAFYPLEEGMNEPVNFPAVTPLVDWSLTARFEETTLYKESDNRYALDKHVYVAGDIFTLPLSYYFDSPTRVELYIFDSTGRPITRFVKPAAEGVVSFNWDGRVEGTGVRAAQGVYLYRIHVDYIPVTKGVFILVK